MRMRPPVLAAWIGILAFACALAPARARAAYETFELEGDIPFYPEGRPLEGLVITLDAGHGGFSHQPGYSGSARGVKSRVVEENLNMLVAAQLRHHLQAAGAQVHMTRWDDRKVAPGASGRDEELGARTRKAVETRSHLFLSLHHNAAGRASADGVMILIWPMDSQGKEQPLEREFANILREEIEKFVPHKEPFDPWENKHPLVEGCDIPSAVVEFGFLTNEDFDTWVARRGSHRDEAIGAYHAIVRMWTGRRAELEAERARLFPETAATPAPTAPPPAGWKRRAAERTDIEKPILALARELWPFDRSPESAAEAQFLLDSYRARKLSDWTTFYLEAKVSREDGRWILRGKSNVGFVREAAAGMLRAAGCEPLENEIELLPSARLGERRYGVARIPMCLLWGGPAEGDNVQTQILLGQPLYLLDESPDGGFLLLHAADGYIGWARAEAVLRLDGEAFREWERAKTATLTRDVMVDEFRLPAGAALPLLAVDTAASSATLALPMGVRSTGGLPRATAPLDALRLPPEVPPGYRAARAASEFLTVPYVFGGMSRIGLDCSGLTRVAWATEGVTLPRDARQQILTGRLVGVPWRREALLPGDLVFFTDVAGRVIHTGVSLGGDRFLHASPPEVHISSFNPADPLYSELWTKHFVFARRPAE